MSLPNLGESKEKELRVVAIGGGTGLSTLLRGLKRYVVSPERRRGIRIGGASAPQAPAPVLSPSLRCIVRELSAQRENGQIIVAFRRDACGKI